MSIRTLAELFLKAAGHNKPDRLLHKVGGTYQPISTAELVDRVRRLAKALEELGVEPRRPGGPDVRERPALADGRLRHPLHRRRAGADLPHAAARPGRLHRPATAAPRWCSPRPPPTWRASSPRPTSCPRSSSSCSIKGRIARPAGHHPRRAPGARRRRRPRPLRAEGARGQARGPRDLHLHQRHHRQAQGGDAHPRQHRLERRRRPAGASASSPSWTALSFLPLSHSFERTVDYIYFYYGCTIAYAESVAAVAQNMQEVKPHVFVSVPRVYEKLLARVQENVATSSPIKQKIFAWAQGVAKEALPWRLKRTEPAGPPGDQARPRRQAGVRQDPRAAGRPLRLRRLGRRAAGARRRRVLLGRRHPDLRGLRPVGDLAGDLGQHPGARSSWARSAGRSTASRCRSPPTARSSPAAPTS